MVCSQRRHDDITCRTVEFQSTPSHNRIIMLTLQSSMTMGQSALIEKFHSPAGDVVVPPLLGEGVQCGSKPLNLFKLHLSASKHLERVFTERGGGYEQGAGLCT